MYVCVFWVILGRPGWPENGSQNRVIVKTYIITAPNTTFLSFRCRVKKVHQPLFFKAFERFRTSVLQNHVIPRLLPHSRLLPHPTAFPSIPAQPPSRVVRGGVPRRSRRRPEEDDIGEGG